VAWVLSFLLCLFLAGIPSGVGSWQDIIGGWLKFLVGFYSWVKFLVVPLTGVNTSWFGFLVGNDISSSPDRRVVTDEEEETVIKDPNTDAKYVTFEQEFSSLPRGQQAPWSAAAKHPELNRVQHHVAYDHSRVIIKNSPLGMFTTLPPTLTGVSATLHASNNVPSPMTTQYVRLSAMNDFSETTCRPPGMVVIL